MCVCAAAGLVCWLTATWRLRYTTKVERPSRPSPAHRAPRGRTPWAGTTRHAAGNAHSLIAPRAVSPAPLSPSNHFYVSARAITAAAMHCAPHACIYFQCLAAGVSATFPQTVTLTLTLTPPREFVLVFFRRRCHPDPLETWASSVV